MQSPTTAALALRVARRFPIGGPCALACDAMQAWAERYVSTPFLIACISTALVWTCSLAVAMLQLAALAALY